VKRLLIVFFLTGLLLFSCGPVQIVPGYIADLVSIRNEDEISGSFFLGCGSIEGTEYVFAFIKKDGKEPILRLKVPMRKCRFYEDGGDKPYVQEWIWTRKGQYPHMDRYDFHIPKDTILKKMELR